MSQWLTVIKSNKVVQTFLQQSQTAYEGIKFPLIGTTGTHPALLISILVSLVKSADSTLTVANVNGNSKQRSLFWLGTIGHTLHTGENLSHFNS